MSKDIRTSGGLATEPADPINQSETIPTLPEDSVTPPTSKNPSPSKGLKKFDQSDQTVSSVLQELCNTVYQHGKATRTSTPFHYGEPLKKAKAALEHLFELEVERKTKYQTYIGKSKIPGNDLWVIRIAKDGRQVYSNIISTESAARSDLERELAQLNPTNQPKEDLFKKAMNDMANATSKFGEPDE